MKMSSSLIRHGVNLLLLGLCCLILEQLAYCLVIAGYLYQVMTSPVFWGSFSVMCFSLLWWSEHFSKNFETSEIAAIKDDEAEKGEYNPLLENPLSLGNPNNMFERNWGWW